MTASKTGAVQAAVNKAHANAGRRHSTSQQPGVGNPPSNPGGPKSVENPPTKN